MCIRVYMYVCMYVCIYVCIHAYTYIHMAKERERERERDGVGSKRTCETLQLFIAIVADSTLPINPSECTVYALVLNMAQSPRG